jgi:hypothetical protein
LFRFDVARFTRDPIDRAKITVISIRSTVLCPHGEGTDEPHMPRMHMRPHGGEKEYLGVWRVQGHLPQRLGKGEAFHLA